MGVGEDKLDATESAYYQALETFGVMFFEAMKMGKATVGCSGEGGSEDLRSLVDYIQLIKAKYGSIIVNVLSNLYWNPERPREFCEKGKEVDYSYSTWRQMQLRWTQIIVRFGGYLEMIRSIPSHHSIKTIDSLGQYSNFLEYGYPGPQFKEPIDFFEWAGVLTSRFLIHIEAEITVLALKG